MKQKPQSGKSRKTKVVSYRLENAIHSKLCKLAGGKKKLNGYLKEKSEGLVC